MRKGKSGVAYASSDARRVTFSLPTGSPLRGRLSYVCHGLSEVKLTVTTRTYNWLLGRNCDADNKCCYVFLAITDVRKWLQGHTDTWDDADFVTRTSKTRSYRNTFVYYNYSFCERFLTFITEVLIQRCAKFFGRLKRKFILKGGFTQCWFSAATCIGNKICGSYYN